MLKRHLRVDETRDGMACAQGSSHYPPQTIVNGDRNASIRVTKLILLELFRQLSFEVLSIIIITNFLWPPSSLDYVSSY